MKKEIEELKQLLEAIAKKVENRLYLEKITIDTLNDTLIEWQDEYGCSKEYVDKFREYVIVNKTEENIKQLKQVDIPMIQELLSSTLEKIRFNDSGLIPNYEFKSLLSRGILTSEQDIFGKFKKQTFIGRLTNDGFFNLYLDDITIVCTDFKDATFKAWKKIIPNDGWDVWSSIDIETGQTRTLNYFRGKLYDNEVRENGK